MMGPASNSGSAITFVETWATQASKPHLSQLVYQMRGWDQRCAPNLLACWRSQAEGQGTRAPSQVLNATTGTSPMPTVTLAPAALQRTWLAGGWWRPGGLGLEEPPGCLQADALPL